MKTILIPTDFSDTAANAGEYAFQLFSKDQACYKLLNTYFEPSFGAGFLVSIVDTLRKDSENSLEQEKNSLIGKFPYLGKSITTESRYGYLNESIMKSAEENKPDYIVMGTKGATGLEKLLFKSNTYNIVDNRKYPIIVVPDGFSFKPPKTIILATDLRIENIFAINPLIEIALKFDAKIKIIHVNANHDQFNDEELVNKRRLEHILNTSSVKYHFQMLDNEDAIKGINDYINSEGDMLALVPHEHTRFSAMFNKSVTKEFTLEANIPLIILPEQGE